MELTAFSHWDYLLYAMALTAIFVVIWAIGGWEWIGEQVAKLLPRAALQQGSKAHIYLNGRYNRTATITKVEGDALYFYDNKVRLPLTFRGRFYGYGIDKEDGSHVVYLAKRGHYRLIRVAELIRKVFRLIEDEENLNPKYGDYIDLLKDEAGEGDGDEC